jgi:hypothetical protein
MLCVVSGYKYSNSGVLNQVNVYREKENWKMFEEGKRMSDV